MQLTIINGSPRGTASNTEKMMSHFIRGVEENKNSNIETYYISKERKDFTMLKKKFLESENVIIGFPLYIDAMPGIVKEFIEALASEKIPRSLKLHFFIQNGFPETYHNRFVERYCEKLTRRLGCTYGGSITKGGCEGLDVQPPAMVEKIYNYFFEIGKSFGGSGFLDQNLLKKLAHPEHLTEENLKQVVPIVNKFMWDQWLKKNNALEKSFAKPYGEDL